GGFSLEGRTPKVCGRVTAATAGGRSCPTVWRRCMADVRRTQGKRGRQRFVRAVGLGLIVVATAAPVSWAGTVPYDPATDVNSMYSTAQYTGATAWWSAGYTGKGIDVAVIDSGVTPVAGLDA